MERTEELEIQKILRLNHPLGISAKDVGSQIGISKHEINSYIYKNLKLFSRGKIKNSWIMCAETDSFMQKLQNREDAKCFSRENFDAIADWSYGKSHGNGNKNEYTTLCGNIIEYDSQYEKQLLEYLEENFLVKALGGQNLCIHYDREFMTNCSYYPDIAALTWDDHIAIIEVKPAAHMSNYKVLDKYDALENYCIKNGYMYVMVDPIQDYTTYEELQNADVQIPELQEFFEENCYDIDTRNLVMFDTEDVNDWFEDYGYLYTDDIDYFYLQVHTLIIQYGWYNKAEYGGFQVYNHPVK